MERYDPQNPVHQKAWEDSKLFAPYVLALLLDPEPRPYECILPEFVAQELHKKGCLAAGTSLVARDNSSEFRYLTTAEFRDCSEEGSFSFDVSWEEKPNLLAATLYVSHAKFWYWKEAGILVAVMDPTQGTTWEIILQEEPPLIDLNLEGISFYLCGFTDDNLTKKLEYGGAVQCTELTESTTWQITNWKTPLLGRLLAGHWGIPNIRVEEFETFRRSLFWTQPHVLRKLFYNPL